MLSIGQFSRACCVSIKTLRHYEKVGLLLPTRVDQWTGYRYYDEGLIPTMLLIQRLKRYGFPLAAIARIISAPDAAPIMLKQQHQELSLQLQQLKLTLHELEQHLASIERTGDLMAFQHTYQIVLQEVPARPILSCRQRMSVEDFGRYYSTLYERAAREHIALDGATMTIYHDEGFDPEDSDLELALGVQDPQAATRMLPGGLMAVTTHRGPYASLSDAYGALTRWIADQGLEATGAPYEIYRQSMATTLSPEAWETDIFYPVKRK